MSVYRLLLALYPASFRREYGSELTALFEQRWRHTSGAVAVFGLWVRRRP